MTQIDFSRLALGCAALGAPRSSLPDAEAHAVIERAWELGIRFFDVAPTYGGGLAEERLGHVLRHLPRDEFVLCTKTGVVRPYGETATPAGRPRRGNDVWDYSAAGTRASIARSLERLGTDRLDFVHLHDVYDHIDTCLDAMPALRSLQEQNVLGGIGIGSNTVEAVEALIARDAFDAVLIAGRYTLLDRSAENLLVRLRQRGIAGFVGGVFNSGVLARWPAPGTYDYEAAEEDVTRRVNLLGQACAEYRVPLRTAALQFPLRSRPGPDRLILGPGSLEELEQIMDDLAQPLPPELWGKLDGLSRGAA